MEARRPGGGLRSDGITAVAVGGHHRRRRARAVEDGDSSGAWVGARNAAQAASATHQVAQRAAHGRAVVARRVRASATATSLAKKGPSLRSPSNFQACRYLLLVGKFGILPKFILACFSAWPSMDTFRYRLVPPPSKSTSPRLHRARHRGQGATMSRCAQALPPTAGHPAGNLPDPFATVRPPHLRPVPCTRSPPATAAAPAPTH